MKSLLLTRNLFLFNFSLSGIAYINLLTCAIDFFMCGEVATHKYKVIGSCVPQVNW